MPIVNIEYDDDKISDKEISMLSEKIYEIVSNIEIIKEVFVYTNSAKIKVNVKAIEIFIRTGAQVMNNDKEIIGKIKNELTIWKKEAGFTHLINLSLIPMIWETEFGI